jgi:glutamate synthase (NADPH/NADH) small chain
MGKATGFKEYQRVDMPHRPVEERVGDYREVLMLQPEPQLRRQGARCMDCGIPFCHAMGCPTYNLIPEWNDLIYRDKWREAYERLELTNNLPEITGRVCPAPCEASCTLSINAAPVTIRQIEMAIIETAFSNGWVVPRKPLKETGKKVAVIGSGPAGLASAQQLRRMGHSVVVFEKADRIGGILRYGIPDFKLEKSVIDRRLDQMRAEGVSFETDVIIGEDISVRYLKKSFDVVLLAMGADKPRDIHVPGRGLDGIYFAMEYLKESNRFVAGDIEEQKMLSAKNKAVLVIGGGDTGADCVGTAVRQGAKQVHQFEILPKPQEWDQPHNPSWPYWPQILRTSTSHEEGCIREWAVTTKSFSGGDVKVEQGQFARVEWNTDPHTGNWVMKEIPGTDFSLRIDMVLVATGFLHVEHTRLVDQLGIDLDTRGNIKTNEAYACSVPGVFAAGDANMGASLVIRAIFHGRQAAAAINEYLMK